MEITKASGEKQKFSEEKIYSSLKKSGVDDALARSIARKVKKEGRSGMKSSEILDKVLGILLEEDVSLAAKYNLKKAIMLLGPTGYPFEKYVAGILEEYGYKTTVGEVIKGHCVDHEIDIITTKRNKHFMVECKFHNTAGNKSDIKIALYTYARFLDVERAWKKKPGHNKKIHQVFLVTNTKCTSEAIRYARCERIKIISWRYPRKENLEGLIESKGLYPITILPSLKKEFKVKLLENDIIFARQLILKDPVDLLKATGIPLEMVKKLQNEAARIK